MDTSALHAVTETFASYLSELVPGDLSFATPCEGWDVGDLHRHMLEENVHFGRAVGGSDLTGAPSHGLDEEYRRTAAFMEHAFATVADATQTRQVPGVPGPRTVQDLYEMQLCDTVIHTWDLAHATGLPYAPEPQVARTVLRRMEAVPGSARGPGRAFAEVPEQPGPATSALGRILLLSGRAISDTDRR
ncbi:TIGR03086 family metal-binding protein [Isoptericola sp. F-RaC21]|uniref:TIGR03086 family metal-binding protein n=1 Tax=Isoptericola sp. F-RaC21 TaxID=3141452 RepID=UPI00315B5668